MASRLKISCSAMASVAIQKTDVPNCTPIAGPTSHSPPPIDVASRIAPGPIVLNIFFAEKGRGSGSSSLPQGGRLPGLTASGLGSGLDFMSPGFRDPFSARGQRNAGLIEEG